MGRRVTAAVATMIAWWVVVPAVALPRSTVDGEGVDRMIEDILRHRDFAAAERSWLERLRDDVRQWFFERLSDLFSTGAGTVLGWVLFGLAIVVLLLVVVQATRGMRRGAVVGAGPRAAIVVRRPPSAWLVDARAAEAAGDLGEAVRCGYRAVVALLASHGDVEEVPGRTVGEYRAQVRASDPARLDEFTRASDVFERVWYARRPASAADVATVVGVADALQAATR